MMNSTEPNRIKLDRNKVAADELAAEAAGFLEVESVRREVVATELSTSLSDWVRPWYIYNRRELVDIKGFAGDVLTHSSKVF